MFEFLELHDFLGGSRELVYLAFSPTSVNSTVSSRPKVVKFGALFTMGSVIGRLALPAIMAAVKDVNSSTSSLPGIDLQVILHDTNCSAFLGTMVFAKT